MMKRFVCALLALIMVVCLVPVTSLTAAAASVSNAAVNFVKTEEGFVEECYADNTQYSIGYGTKCPGSDEEHKEGVVHTITEKKAKAALAEELESAAAAVNKFASKHGLSLSQGQFDALVSFSYNCGTGWMYADGIFRQAVIGGKTGNDFLYAITLWSVGGEGLARRRLCEANMYLNGKYSNTAPSRYTYVRLDPNGGNMEYNIQGYDTVEPVGIKETPTYEGYKFMGWYDEEGKWVSTLNASTSGQTLTAQWQEIGGGVSGGTIEGTPASYTVSASQATSLNVYKLPGTGAEIVGTVKKNATVEVVAEYIDIDNVKWVNLADGGWMNMGDVQSPVIQNTNVTVKVTNQYINVRASAGATADIAIVGKVYYNDELRITEVKGKGEDKWGKFEKGWVALKYTNYDEVVSASKEEESTEIESDGNKTVIATGTVKVSTYIRVRQAPDKNAKELNQVYNGTKVTIYQIEKVGTEEWGRINTGWICLTGYVTLDKEVDAPATDDEDTDTDSAILASGVVNSNTNLSVRKGPATTNALITTLPKGTKVDIYETTVTLGHTWGRIHATQERWVCLTYVTLDNANDLNGEGVKGTIVNCSAGANIRTAAGIGNALVGVAPVGSSVTVYQQTTVNGVKWGRIDKGWVCMDYVLLEGTLPEADGSTDSDTNVETESNGLSTGTVAEESLTIYKEASAASKEVGSLIKGSKITVTELVIEEGTSNIWGKTASGWVDMDGISINAKAVVNTKTGGKLNVRDGNCDTNDDPVDKLNNGAQVTITAVQAVNGTIWGQIDAEKDHWISLSLVKLNAIASGSTSDETEKTPEEDKETDTTPDTNVESTVKTGVIANTNAVNVRKAAGVRNALVTTLARGTKVTVYEQVTQDNAPWGRIGENQWVAMVYVALDATSSGTTTGGTTSGTTGDTTGTTANATGIVNSNVNLNVRTGPGTNYPQVATLVKGTKITVYEQKVAQGMTWGRIGENQWVSLSYVTMTGSGSTGTGVMGTIARCYYAVNVRSAPGVGNALVGTIMVGSRVEIYEQQAYGGSNWGRVNQGWICMDYVLLDAELPGGTIPGTDSSSGSTGSSGSTDTETENKQPELVTGFSTGSISSTSDVAEVYSEASGAGELVGELVNGTAVTVSEMVADGDIVWGKIATGWIDMDNVAVNAYAVVSTKTGGKLNVRDSSCDTSATPVAKLDNGSQVVITDVKVANDAVWGQIDAEKDHWISLSLVKLNAKAAASNNNSSSDSNTSAGANTNTGSNTTIGNTTVANGSVLYTGSVTGTVDGVRIRSTPSTKGTELGKLKNGTPVNIYEIAVAEYMAWGKCDSGWVCLTYVDLKPTKEGAIDTRVVWHENLAIRADAGIHYEQLAAYAKCTVVDIYEISGNWGRTVDGWVCLDYLLP